MEIEIHTRYCTCVSGNMVHKTVESTLIYHGNGIYSVKPKECKDLIKSETNAA